LETEWSATVNEMELIELLWNINREIIKRLKPFASDAGLSLTEAFVLWKTHKAGTKRVIALADELGLVPSTLTGVLDRLVEAGWLVRENDPEDRRAVVMKATAKLSELLKTFTKASSDSFASSLRALPAGTKTRLKGDLEGLLDCLQQGKGGK
jgi:DNA-binding MarR family transcriptional regulator